VLARWVGLAPRGDVAKSVRFRIVR